MDRRSTSDINDVKKSALDLEIAGIKVIPVAIGDQADKNELVITIPYKDNLIDPDDNDPANRTADKIIMKAIEGKKNNRKNRAMTAVLIVITKSVEANTTAFFLNMESILRFKDTSP